MKAEEESISEVHDEGSCTRTVVLSTQKNEDSTGIIEETPSAQQWRRQNLFLEIPSRTLDDSEDFVRINMPPTPISTPTRAKLPPTPSPSSRTNASPYFSSKGKSSFKSLLPKLSFKHRNSSLDTEKASMLATGAPLAGPHEKTSVARSLSLTKIFTPRMKRTSSLPVTPIAHSNPNSVHGGSMIDPSNSTKNVVKHHISRSLSVPVKARSIRRMDSLGAVYRVIPSTPRVTEGSGTTSNISAAEQSENNDADGEDIAEEEAVCRICLIELGEGGVTLKMECSCKGELALAHQECAVKWFSIKGNKNCDICKQEVQNLPVTLLRVQSVQILNTRANRGQQTVVQRYRQVKDDILVWQDVPVLVIISMLAYFCFLEQLLVAEMGTGAIAISLPFSCILGLLASMTSSTMVERKFVWVYASVQFVLVVLFAHIFYSLLHVQSVLSILLSTFAGFGLAMSGSSIFVEFMRWRRKWVAWSNHRRRSQGTSEPDQRPEEEHPPQRAHADHHETETANPVTAQGS
ncbi:zinc finger protein [Macleaya cordata]|uniref:Zinc finger protein n=1 Tax=Macleaya cordata TaxID=56857 RepID=A0A200QI18_MACCD|nr:zinc finger protein [Macleaya cordata]